MRIQNVFISFLAGFLFSGAYFGYRTSDSISSQGLQKDIKNYVFYIDPNLEKDLYLPRDLIRLIESYSSQEELFYLLHEGKNSVEKIQKFELVLQTSLNSIDVKLSKFDSMHTKTKRCKLVCILGTDACNNIESKSTQYQMSVTHFNPKNRDKYEIIPFCREIFIVLGNMPLAPNVVSSDTISRIKVAAENVKNEESRCLLLSGGPTARVFPGTREEKQLRLTEAEMMALAAVMGGVLPSQIMLENESHSTQANAVNSEKLLSTKYSIEDLREMTIYIVSRKEHLEWAIPLFEKAFKESKMKEFKSLEATITKEEIISQMEQYIRENPKLGNCDEWFCVKSRLSNVRKGVRGID